LEKKFSEIIMMSVSSVSTSEPVGMLVLNVVQTLYCWSLIERLIYF